MTEASLRWEKGGTAWVVGLSGEAITLRSTHPAPPGARLDGELTEQPATKVRVKVQSCKRGDDGIFEIRGRLVDATRALREKVASLAEPVGAFPPRR